MPIQELARDDVVSASTDATVRELARTMDHRSVGSVVITDGDEPMGIVTDRDLTTRVLTEADDPDGWTATDVMSTNLWTLEPDAGFYEAARLMADNGIRRLPVCTDDGSLEGIITADDLTELLADESQHLAAVIRAQRPEY
ncbi:CBS domain-containing protein [Natronomonas salina]|uniref:CBS domain-containing protein n=1 Tax=Natronomonas salina TaxID=1710540 RepID=UPI0015B55485|nr:CBS domain-containing protein [Natronomonas salina]